MRWFLLLVEPRPCDRSRTGVHHAGTGMVPPHTDRHPAVMPLRISTALLISSGWAPWLLVDPAAYSEGPVAGHD